MVVFKSFPERVKDLALVCLLNTAIIIINDESLLKSKDQQKKTFQVGFSKL